MSEREHGGNALLVCAEATLVGPRGALFEPVSFEIAPGEAVCLIGPNGAGKSLFLRALGGSPLPSGFRLDGLIRKTSSGAKSVFLLPQLQVPEVHLPYTLGEISSLDGSAEDPFPWFDGPLASQPWNVASGGERARALLARAFSSQARLLLLDEPFNHLDAQAARAVRETMHAVTSGRQARSIVFVSHAETQQEDVLPRNVRYLDVRPTVRPPITPLESKRGSTDHV